MSDKLIDVRTPLAMDQDVRVEIGNSGEMYVVMPALTLHLERKVCERLTNTLARALVRLHKLEKARERPRLHVVREEAHASEITTGVP